MDVKPIRILLIEDDEDDYVLVKDFLSEVSTFNYVLDWESNHEAGLSVLIRENHDVCLLDFRLGSRDGLDLLRESLKKNVKTPIILLTGKGNDAIDLQAMELGAADYLIKGQTNGDQLKRAIRYSIERKRVNDILNESKEQLKALSSQLIIAQEEERKQVAGEIHDAIGSSLSAVKFTVERALSKIRQTAPEISGLLEPIIPIVQESIEECRRIQQALRPPMIDNLGLLATLSWFTRTFQSVYSHIRIEKEIGLKEKDLPINLRMVIFRIIQEAMNNLAKHSQADWVGLILQKSKGRIELFVRDNGKGFNVNRLLARKGPKKGMGLLSMKERALLSGGTLSVESAVGKGTVVKAVWPI